MKRRMISFVLILTLMMSMLSVTASARAISNMYETPALTAGTWWSGIDSNSIIGITSASSNVYGGDAGVYFYATSVGMPASFVRSTSRTIDIELKEKDTVVFTSTTLVRQYVGYFSTENGVYRVRTYSNTYTNSGLIEDNSILELYMRFKVNTVSGDTSKSVPKGLIQYQVWAD